MSKSFRILFRKCKNYFSRKRKNVESIEYFLFLNLCKSCTLFKHISIFRSSCSFMRIRNEHALALPRVEYIVVVSLPSDSERRLIKLHSRHFLLFCRKASSPLFICVHRSRRIIIIIVVSIGVVGSPSAYRSKQSAIDPMPHHRTARVRKCVNALPIRASRRVEDRSWSKWKIIPAVCREIIGSGRERGRNWGVGTLSRCACTRMHAHLSVSPIPWSHEYTFAPVTDAARKRLFRRVASRRSSNPPSPAAPCIRGIIYSQRGSIAIGRVVCTRGRPATCWTFWRTVLSREINARRAAGCHRRHDVIQ